MSSREGSTCSSGALVVVVGGADERVPEPRQREDRAPAAGRHDRAADQRQVLVAERDVRAAARPDARQLGLVVQLLRAQLVGPHAGRVDHVRGAHLEAARRSRRRAPARRCARPSRSSSPVDVEAVGADRAEALGLAEHGQHEAHVVGLAVVEQVAAGRLARGERRQQLEHLLAGDHAVALRAPGLAAVEAADASRSCPGRARRVARFAAARAQPIAVDRHHVVEVQPDPHQAVRARAVERRHDQRQRAHQVRRERHHQLALEQRLAHEPEVEVLQVAQPAVDELARAAGGPRGEVGALEQRHAVAARGGVERDARAGDAATDDDDVELVLRQRRESLAALDHEPQSRRAASWLRSARARR